MENKAELTIVLVAMVVEFMESLAVLSMGELGDLSFHWKR